MGNTQLKAEHSNSLTASALFTHINRKQDLFFSELGVFYNHYDNLIDYALNPLNTDEYIMLNIADYTTLGINFEQKYQHNQFFVKVGALLLGQYNMAADNEELSSQVARYNWIPELSAELNYTIPKTRTTFNLFYKFVGKQNSFSATTDTANNWIAIQTRRDAYQVSDFSIIQPIKNNIKITGGIRNLFNTTVIQNTSQQVGSVHNSVQDINFNYGRSYFIKLSYALNPKLPSKSNRNNSF